MLENYTYRHALIINVFIKSAHVEGNNFLMQTDERHTTIKKLELLVRKN